MSYPMCILAALVLALAACGGGGGSSAGDTTAPAVTVTFFPTAVLGGGTTTATMRFSEDVTGILVGDFAVTGGVAGTFTPVDARTYTLVVTADGAGATTVDVTAAAAAGKDAAGNASGSATASAAIAYAPWASATGTDSAGVWADLTVAANGVTAVQRFRLIAPGTFTMGSPSSEVGRNIAWPYETETQHRVTLSEPYWIGDSECTQRMWKAVLNTKPSYHQPAVIPVENLDLPVEQVSWTMVQTFLTALNVAKPDLLGRLPTESEWEYAARAGTSTPFGVSPLSTDTINCDGTTINFYMVGGIYRSKTVTTKSLAVNAWGLYECHGNLIEWCSDWWQADLGTGALVDPTGPASGTDRVLRGGGYANGDTSCRSANRGCNVPGLAHRQIGFRLAAAGRPAGPG